jgi:hypothetical protein
MDDRAAAREPMTGIDMPVWIPVPVVIMDISARRDIVSGMVDARPLARRASRQQ